MTNKEFAEKNAGRKYLYDGEIVRVVGYLKWDGSTVLLEAKIGHWSGKLLDDGDVFTHKVYFKKFKSFQYAQVDDLKINMRYE